MSLAERFYCERKENTNENILELLEYCGVPDDYFRIEKAAKGRVYL